MEEQGGQLFPHKRRDAAHRLPVLYALMYSANLGPRRRFSFLGRRRVAFRPNTSVRCSRRGPLFDLCRLQLRDDWRIDFALYA
jgi:hypothetical protein